MAGTINSLTDFFVSVGFDIDKPSAKRTVEAHKQVELRLVRNTEEGQAQRAEIDAKEAAARAKKRQEALKKEEEAQSKSLKSLQSYAVKASGLAITAFTAIQASALGVVYAVDKAAKSFEKMNYAGQRAGATPAKLGAFGYAASQLGASKDEAEGQLQGFGQRLKTNGPGYARALARLGIKARDDKGKMRDSADIATDLGDALRKMQAKGPYGYANAQNQASVFGFEGDTFRALMNPDFRKREGQFASDQGKVGANTNQTAQAAKDFEQSMSHLNEVLGQIQTKVVGHLSVSLKPLIDRLTKFAEEHGSDIADIINDIGDALIAFAKAVTEKLETIDWKKVSADVHELTSGFTAMLGKLGGEVGLVAMLGLMATHLKTLGGLGLPPWLRAILGLSAATDLAIPNDKKPGMIKRWDDSAGGLPSDLAGSDMDEADRRAGVRRGRRGFMLRRNADLRDGGGSSASIQNGEFRAKAPGIARRLKADFGLNDDEAAAVLGNLGHESAGFKAFNEGGNGPGRGWAQWTDPGRKARFFEYAQLNKLDPRSDEANYGFLRWELRNTHKGAIDALKKGRTLEEKTVAFEGAFEGARVKAYGSRLNYARAAQDAMRNEPVTKLPPMLKAGAAGRPLPPMPDHVKLFPGESFGADGKTVVLQPQHTSMRGDTNVTHNPTYHIAGADVRQNMEAARLSASRGQDLLRNVQGTLA